MSRFDRIVRRHEEPGAEGGEALARPRLNSRRKRRRADDRARFAALESLSQPIDFGPVFEAAGVAPSTPEQLLERRRADDRARFAALESLSQAPPTQEQLLKIAEQLSAKATAATETVKDQS